MTEDASSASTSARARVKAVAITPRRRGARGLAEEPYALSTPRPGWAEQDPDDWWRAAKAALARLPDGPDRALGPDARARRARRRRPRAPSRDPLERRPDGRGVRRDRGARIGLERLIELTGNRALAGLHRAEAALAAPARARDATRGSAASSCRRTTSSCASPASTSIDVADASGTLLFDVGAPALVGRGVRRRSSVPTRVAARRASSRPRSRARATRPRPRSASAIDRPGPGVGRARDVRRRLRACCRATRPTAGARVHSSATRCRARGTRWA